MKKPTYIDAWHFIQEDRMLRYGHDQHRQMPGVVEQVFGQPVLCQHGLHASRKVIDAAYYAPGSILCRVRVGGEIIEGYGKLVGTKRQILWMADATEMLQYFIDIMDARAVRASEVAVRDSAKDEWDAAWYAAGVAAVVTTGAARAARAAAWYAAGVARASVHARIARVAARDAARAAAWEAGWDAAWNDASTTLERMVWMLCGPDTAQF